MKIVEFKFGIKTTKKIINGQYATVVEQAYNLSKEARELLQALGFQDGTSFYTNELFPEKPFAVVLKERILQAIEDLPEDEQDEDDAEDKAKVIKGVSEADSPEALYKFIKVIKSFDLSKYKVKPPEIKKVKTPYFNYLIAEKIILTTDYNPEVVTEARKLNGAWDAYSKTWNFDIRDLDRVKAFLLKIFGTDGETEAETVDVKVFLDKMPSKAYVHTYGQSVFALGRQLAIRKFRDSKVNLGDNVTILEGGFPSYGGSQKNPRLNHEDDTILLVRDVPRKVVESDELWCSDCYEIVGEEKKKTAESDDTSPKIILGKKRQISLPNGEKHNAQFAIVELDDIKASHDEDTFADTEGYPRNNQGNNLNDRNYATDKGAQQLVEDYARNLNPELLIALTSTPEGTPIITPDGIVVSGNNRTMSLKLAAKRYPEKWKLYQESLLMDLDVYGLDDFAESKNDALPPSSTMKRPVLVRIDYEFGDLTTNNMAKYNASAMKAKSPVDKAAELATTLREQILCETNIPKIIGEFDTLSDFYADRAAIKRMVNSMQQCSVLNEQDMPAYLENGYFTEDGKTLLETILAALILEPDTLRIANRNGVKSLRQAVVNALPILIANKNLDQSASLIPDVNAAIRYQGEIVASGLTWENFVNQGNIFSDDRPSCNTVYLNRLMNEGQRIFREAILKYNESQAQAGLSALFASDIVTPQEAFEGYIISKLPDTTVKRVKLYCEAKGTAPAPVPAPKAAPVPAPDPVKSSKQELESRLKLLNKRLDKMKGEDKQLAKSRIKIITKMLEKL